MKICKAGHLNPKLYSSGECRLCRLAKAKKEYAENPEPAKLRSRAWHAANRVRAAVRAKAWRKENIVAVKAAARKHYLANKEKFKTNGWLQRGIDPVAARCALATHDGACQLCHTIRPGGKSNSWHVDHDHKTGKVRGVLCNACNTGLGLLKDDPALMECAAAYVRKHA